MKQLSTKQMADGLGVPPSRVSEWKSRAKNPMPMTSIESAAGWRRVHAPARAKKPASVPQSRQGKPSGRRAVPAKGDDWQSRLERTKRVERQIFDSITKAIKQGDVTLLARLQSARASALREIRDAEEMAIESELETKSIVRMADGLETIRVLCQPLRDALDKLPLAERTNCNPDHPEIAERALTEWRDRLLAIGNRHCKEWMEKANAKERAEHPFRPLEKPEPISHPVPSGSEEKS
jgi:hypothetical protein